MRYAQPDKEGFWWGKLIHPAEGTADGEDVRSTHWEVMEVYEADNELRVFVPGVARHQNIEDFVWGPKVPDFNAAFGGAER